MLGGATDKNSLEKKQFLYSKVGGQSKGLFKVGGGWAKMSPAWGHSLTKSVTVPRPRQMLSISASSI